MWNKTVGFLLLTLCVYGIMNNREDTNGSYDLEQRNDFYNEHKIRFFRPAYENYRKLHFDTKFSHDYEFNSIHRRHFDCKFPTEYNYNTCDFI